MRRAIVFMIIGTASAAEARPWDDIGFGAQLQYEASTLHDVDHEPDMAPAPKDFAMAGARLHGFVGGDRWGYHIGLDFAGGQTVRPHSYFAWDVAFFPVGLAMRFGETSFITLGGGIGTMGAIGTLDDAMTMPLEARFEIGRANRIIGRVRASYLYRSDERKDGGVTTPFADELEASLGFRLGDAYNDWGMDSGDGYFIAANYRESLGARFFGVTLGFSVDMGSERKKQKSYDGEDGYSGCPDCD